jgi:type II secretory pathway component PulF
MGFITTPGQLKNQGEFYHQLASMTAAGVTIVQAVEMLSRNAPTRKLSWLATQIKDSIIRGHTFTEAMRATGRRLPEFDVALIEAGESSGRLDQCFRLLGDFYVEGGKLAAKVLSELIYPVFLFHFAVMIFPTSLLADFVWKGNTQAFVTQKLAILLPTYVVIGFILWSLQSERSRAWRGKMEAILDFIPVIRSTRRHIALARLCAALEALINAGVLIIEAWDLAGRASGSFRIQRAVSEAKPRLQVGELPSEAISRQPIYPELFTSSYRTGEMSGQLEETLRRLYRHYLDAATTGLHRLAEWLPKLIYFGVLIGIAVQIISFWSGYFDQINHVIQQ